MQIFNITLQSYLFITFCIYYFIVTFATIALHSERSKTYFILYRFEKIEKIHLKEDEIVTFVVFTLQLL